MVMDQHLNQPAGAPTCDIKPTVYQMSQHSDDKQQQQASNPHSKTPELTVLSSRQMSNQTRDQIDRTSSQDCELGHGISGLNSANRHSNSSVSSNSDGATNASSIYLTNPSVRSQSHQSHQSSNFRSSVDNERRSCRPQKFCAVCGDKAIACNFNAVTCESCKAFFRRNAYKEQRLKCLFENRCTIDRVTRRFCSKCRLLKCFQIGMKREWILTDEQKRIKKVKIMQNKQSRLQVLSGKSIRSGDQQIRIPHHRKQSVGKSIEIGHHNEADVNMSQHKSSNSLYSGNQTSSSSSSASSLSLSSSPSSTTPSCLSPVGPMSRSASSSGLLPRDATQLRRVQMVDASTSCALDEFEPDPYGNLAARLVQYCSMASQCQYCSIKLADSVHLRQQQSQFASVGQLHYQTSHNQFVSQQTPPTNQVAQHHAPQVKTNLPNANLYSGQNHQVYLDDQQDRQHSLNRNDQNIQSGQQQQLPPAQVSHQLHQDTHNQVVGNHPYGNINDNGNNTGVNHQLSDNRNSCPMNHQIQMAAVIGSSSQDIINNNSSSNPFSVSYCCMNQPNIFPSVSQ